MKTPTLILLLALATALFTAGCENTSFTLRKQTDYGTATVRTDGGGTSVDLYLTK